MSKRNPPLPPTDDSIDLPIIDWDTAVDDWDASVGGLSDLLGSVPADSGPSVALPKGNLVSPANNVIEGSPFMEAGSQPMALGVDADNDLVVIPNLEELSAAVQVPRSPDRKAESQQNLLVAVESTDVSVTETTYELTEPLAHVAVRPEEVLLAQDTVPVDAFDPFSGLPPASHDTELGAAPLLPVRRLDGFVANVNWNMVVAPTDGPTKLYKEERLALLADELEARQAEGSPGVNLAWVAVEAARAAHMSGATESVHRLIDRACKAAPDHVAPRRERLRLFARGELRKAALADKLCVLVNDVAERAGNQRTAYAGVARSLKAVAGSVVTADDDDVGLVLVAAAHQLRGDDGSRTAKLLTVAGRGLSGQAGAALLYSAARLLEFHGIGDRGGLLREQARLLDPKSRGSLFAMLRLSGSFSRGDTLASLQDALAEVDDDTLKGALGRWAMSLAEAAGDPLLGAELLGLIVDGKPLIDLRVAERLCLLQLHVSDLLDNPEGWVEGLSPHDSALLLAAGAEMALRIPREAESMELLDRALSMAPDGLFPAMLAERICNTVSSPAVRSRGLALWARGDAARVGMALLERCGGVDSSRDSGVEDEQLVAAQNAALAALGNDAAFLSFAWDDVIHRRFGSAASRFERGAGAFLTMGEPEFASIIHERAEDSLAAEAPTRAVVRAMSRSSSVEESLDHPRVLALAPLENVQNAAAVAALYRSAATPCRQATLRVLEAASWMKASGQRRQAVQFLLARVSATPNADEAAMFLRVLSNTYDDAETAANVFERLAARCENEEQKSFWLFRRAEALGALGRAADSASILGDIVSGPLASEARLAYRRTLWMSGALNALDGQLRDESDGYRGVGQNDKAAAVLVERSHLRAEGLYDVPGALGLLLETLSLQPGNVSLAMRTIATAAVQRNAAAFGVALSCLSDAGDTDAQLLALLEAESHSESELAASLLLRAHNADPHRTMLIARRFSPSLSSSEWLALGEAAANRVDGDPRLLLQLELRAAESLARDGNVFAAQGRLAEVVCQDPRNLPALRLFARVAQAANDNENIIRAIIGTASISTVAKHQSRLYFEAAVLVGLKDSRAEVWLRKALESDPGNDEAFAQLRGVVEEKKDLAALAELIRVRQRSSLRREDSDLLRFERASLLDKTGDRAGAKSELRTVLLRDPQNVTALRSLVELEYQDGAYSIAAEMYLRLARIEESPVEQAQIFRRLGRIYHRRLSDPKLAAGAFERVLKLDANDLDALTGLSDIYSKQNDLQKALSATERAVERESDDKRRLGLLLRLAGLYEKNADVRKAGALFRRAHEQAPRSLQAIGELARYLERHKDAKGRRVLLDTSLSRLHEDLRRFPGDLSALRVIVPVLRWCSRAAGSAASAQLLAALSDDPVESRELQGWSAAPAKGRRLSPLLNPEVDEMAYPSRLPPGLRQVMRVLGPPMSKASRPDLRRYGVLRAERIAVGEGPRSIIDALAVDLGVRGYEVFVTTDLPNALLVEPGDPPAIVLGSDLVKRGPIALRFAAGYALRLVSTHFDLLAAPDPGPEALLTALVRQFLNVPVDDGAIPEAAIEQVLPRLNKALGRSQRAELRPFVAEMASRESLANIASSVQATAARVGLLAAGDLAVAIEVLLAAAGKPLSPTNLGESQVASGLFEFALSANYELLVRSIDSVS